MKPSREELREALAEAERLRDQNADGFHIAKSLLYLARRDELLEELLHHVRVFTRFGMPPQEHAALLKLLARIERLDQHESEDDRRETDLFQAPE